MKKMENKFNKYKNKAQVTIFIIVGILIVVAIIGFFLLFGRFDFQERGSLNVEQFIETCVKDAVEPSVGKVLAGGGRAEPSFYKMYQGEKYNYLCYQKNYYLTCVNQYPMLKAIAEQEIKQDSEERVNECFASLKKDWEDRGYDVSDSALDWRVELSPKTVLISIEKRLDFSKGSASETYSEFSVNFLSPLYDLVMVAREIVNQEAEFCNFEYNGFMLLYPEYDIKRISYDENRIYKITDRRSGGLFKFALRSCALPPGL